MDLLKSIDAQHEKYLERLLKLDEGYRRYAYTDTTGNLSIGIGRNLKAKGISPDEALVLLHNDIREAEQELMDNVTVFFQLDDVRKIVLIDMNFNLGIGKFLMFAKMLRALNNKDYNKAADEMLNSKWAQQVGMRAQRLAEMMRTGVLLNV